jgi:hypothetical protein
VFTVVTTKIRKKFKIIPKVVHDIKYDRSLLSGLYLFAGNSGITLEMISYDLSQDEMDLLHAELDRMGTNPFRYATSLKSPQELMKELPYRPEVLGVCDIPSRQLMYGHWSYTLR